MPVVLTSSCTPWSSSPTSPSWRWNWHGCMRPHRNPPATHARRCLSPSARRSSHRTSRSAGTPWPSSTTASGSGAPQPRQPVAQSDLTPMVQPRTTGSFWPCPTISFADPKERTRILSAHAGKSPIAPDRIRPRRLISGRSERRPRPSWEARVPGTPPIVDGDTRPVRAPCRQTLPAYRRVEYDARPGGRVRLPVLIGHH